MSHVERPEVRASHDRGGVLAFRIADGLPREMAGLGARAFSAGAMYRTRYGAGGPPGRPELEADSPDPRGRASSFTPPGNAVRTSRVPDGGSPAASVPRDIHLFPGQGDFSLSPLLRARGHLRSITREVFEEVDLVTARHGLPMLAPWLLGADPPRVRELAQAPVGVMQLAVFGASLAVHWALRESFGPPDAMVGVSFGEIAALTAAGAFDLTEGAEIAWELARILTSTCPGGLTLLGCGESATHALLARAAAQDIVVACVNDEQETAVSGPIDQLRLIEKTAAEREIPAVRLRLPFSSHHPALRSQAGLFARAVRRHPARPTNRVVLSAVARRPYTPGEDVPARLADCLVLPAHVPDVINLATSHTLPGQTVRLFEAGTGSALSRNARRILAGRPATVHAPLADPGFSW